MTAIIDQQVEFQNMQAANSNLRQGWRDRRQRLGIINHITEHHELCRRTGPSDRRAIISTLEREMLLS